MRCPNGMQVLAAVAIGLGGPQLLAAQFVTPLPPPLERKYVAAEYYQDRFFEYLRKTDPSFLTKLESLAKPAKDTAQKVQAKQQKESLFAANKDTIPKLVERFCNLEVQTGRKELCGEALDTAPMFANSEIIQPRVVETDLPFSLPFFHRNRRRAAALASYLESARGSSGVELFNQFTANVSNKTAYVTTDIISGVAGGTVVAVQYAAVVVKDTSPSPAQRSVIEDNTATALRMINNGGTVTGRFQYPMWAIRGITSEAAASVYGIVGVIGPAASPDSLRLSVSGVAEFMTGLTIRGPGPDGSVLGDLIAGVRGGVGWSRSELLPGSGERWIPYAQLAVGLRQNGKIGLSILYTWVGKPDVYRRYVPKFIVNFSAFR